MTDERLDQILKQALTPAINDSEIEIRRKVRSKKMNVKKILAVGLAACAVVTLAVTGGLLRGSSNSGGEESADVNSRQETASNNIFAITAYAAELPDDTSSGDVIDIRPWESSGSSRYLSGRFMISGQNIERIRVATDQCELYTAVPVYSTDPDYENALKEQKGEIDISGEYEPVFSEDPSDDFWQIDYFEHLTVVGQSYEGEYDNQMSFGMSLPEELWSTLDDVKAASHEDIDRVDGATLTITVTFTDGSTQEHHYRLNTGKIYVPVDEDGYNQWGALTRFLTDDESKTETGYTYGYLLERMD